MRTTYLIATTVIGLALAAPLAAHHNSPAEPDIGDMMGRHEAAIDDLGSPGRYGPVQRGTHRQRRLDARRCEERATG